MHPSYPRLLGDIGGTNSRWSWELAAGQYSPLITFKTTDFLGPEAMLAQIINSHPHYKLHSIGIAVATPILGDEIKLTNANWHFSLADLGNKIGTSITVLNDFAAQAYALARFHAADILPIGENKVAKRATKIVMGPGTGLGVAQLLPLCTDSESCWLALPGEGGHSSFSPNTDLDIELLRYAKKQWQHVSWERIISGAGLELIYSFLAERNQSKIKILEASEITTQAEKNPLCIEAMHYFSTLLGNAAANYVLIANAQGGVYIAGGVLGHFGNYFDQKKFRAAFESKGRFSEWLHSVPSFLVQDPLAAFKGISYYLDKII